MLERVFCINRTHATHILCLVGITYLLTSIRWRTGTRQKRKCYSYACIYKHLLGCAIIYNIISCHMLEHTSVYVSFYQHLYCTGAASVLRKDRITLHTVPVCHIQAYVLHHSVQSSWSQLKHMSSILLK